MRNFAAIHLAVVLTALACGSEQHGASFHDDMDAGGTGGSAGESDAAEHDCSELRGNVTNALDELQGCSEHEDCGSVVNALSRSSCTGPNVTAVRADANTDEYLEALNVARDAGCDTGGGDIETQPPCEDDGPRFPVLCENNRCAVVSNFCSALDGELFSEKTYQCTDEPGDCSWFVSFETNSAMVTWDYPGEGLAVSTPQTFPYRCGMESLIQILVDGNWEQAGIAEGRGGVTWLGGHYEQLPIQ